MAPRRPVLSLRQLASARVKVALIRYLSLKTKEVNLIQQNAKLNAQLFREHCRVALQEIDENFPVCLRSVFGDSFKKLKDSNKRINVNNVKDVIKDVPLFKSATLHNWVIAIF
jgi:hypothetical protein